MSTKEMKHAAIATLNDENDSWMIVIQATVIQDYSGIQDNAGHDQNGTGMARNSKSIVSVFAMGLKLVAYLV